MSASVVSEKEKFIWNSLGSLSNAMATVVLTICVNRIMGAEAGGIFALAYSNAQLMLTISGFEARNYQATDVAEKYSFTQYFTFRIITCVLTIPIVLWYIFHNSFTLDEGWVVLLLALFKVIESFTDVYGTRFQQKDRIDLTGKLFFVRVVVSTGVFIVLLFAVKNLVIASLGLMFTSMLLFFIYDYRFVSSVDRGFHLDFKQMGSLFMDTFPLFVGTFIMMYISNAPKYAINDMYDNTMQNVYNILFMPAFVINLFSLFAFRPLLVKMALYWNEHKLRPLVKVILILNGGIILFVLFVMLAAWLLGIPVLSFLYGIDLSAYRVQLLMVMVTGGLNALMVFANNVLVVIRKQNVLIPICAVSFLFSLIILPEIVRRYAITGAIAAYGIAIGGIMLLYNVAIVLAMIKEKNRIR